MRQYWIVAVVVAAVVAAVVVVVVVVRILFTHCMHVLVMTKLRIHNFAFAMTS
jgi:hypothetical protein